MGRKLDSLPGRVLRQTQEETPVTNKESQGRQIFPSDRSRRERTVTAVLPDIEMVKFLKSEAKRLDEERQASGEGDMTPSRFAALLLVAALEQWRNGKLELTRQPTSMELERVEDLIVPRS